MSTTNEARRPTARHLCFSTQLTGLGLIVLTLVACGPPRVKLTEETLAERLEWIDDTVPLCETTPAGAPAGAMRHAAVELDALVRMARPATRHAATLGSGRYRSAGSCGGELDFTFDHAHGDTDYEVLFDAFCVMTPDGALILDGAMSAREEGRPTPSGPMISALEVRTEGPIEVAHRGETILYELDRARTEYGNPATFSPGVPTADDPDVITITRGSATYPTGRVDFVRQVRIERHGGEEATVHIVRGDLGSVGEGTVRIQTAEDAPIRVSMSSGELLTGTVEFHGSGGSVVEATLIPSQAGRIDITLNGEPYADDLDCTKGVLPIAELAASLMSVLPIY